MIIKSTKIEGVKIIYPNYFKDQRGFFVEVYKKRDLKKIFSGNFVQENKSFSSNKWTFRGMHFQTGKYSQDKLVSITKGSVIDFIFDLRSKSKTYKKFLKIKINENSNFLIFIPKGCAHGFLTTSKNTIFNYRVSNYYNKHSEDGINFDSIKKSYKLPKKILISDKDKNGYSLGGWLENKNSDNFIYGNGF
jgi:dTDP-4-dehydrorhamnose 3,5-epimerase